MENHEWQSLLVEGNKCYKQQLWSQAELFYSLAYQLLHKACEREPTDSDTLMAWICTCHNLSSLFEAQGDLNAALRYLLLPHEYCRNQIDTAEIHEDVKVIAINALNLTWSQLLSFSRKHPYLAQLESSSINPLQALKAKTMH